MLAAPCSWDPCTGGSTRAGRRRKGRKPEAPLARQDVDLENKRKKVYTSAEFDGFKRKLAGYIIELRRVLGQAALAPAAAPVAVAPKVAPEPARVAVEEAPVPGEKVEPKARPARRKPALTKPKRTLIAVGVAAVVAVVVIALMLIFRRKR